jgi:hypothetical protein
MRKTDICPRAAHAQTSPETLPSSGNETAPDSAGRILVEAQSLLSKNVFRILNDKTIPSDIRKILRSATISFRRNTNSTLVEKFETAVGERHYIRIDRVTLIVLINGDVRILENILFANCLNDGPNIDPTPGAALPLSRNRGLLTSDINISGRRNRGHLVACCRALILILGAISFYLCTNVKAIAGIGAPTGFGLLYRLGPGATKTLDKCNAKNLIRQLYFSVFCNRIPSSKKFFTIWKNRIQERSNTSLSNRSSRLGTGIHRIALPDLKCRSYYRQLLLARSDAAKGIGNPSLARRVSLAL